MRDALAEMALWTYVAESMMVRTAELVSASVQDLDAAGDCGRCCRGDPR